METSFAVCGFLGCLGIYNLLKDDDGNVFKFLFWFLVLLGCVLFPVFAMIATG